MREKHHGTLTLVLAHAALFASGAAALVYESCWGRMLHTVFGVSDEAVATVLGAYFAGLGLGALWAGRRAERSRQPGLFYVAMEVLIALIAMLSPALLPLLEGLHVAAVHAFPAAAPAARLVLALLVLLPPTWLMGATLPFLVAHTRQQRRSEGEWTRSAASLYVFNTIGAVLGAALSGLYLVPEFGLSGAIYIAAGTNLVAAALVFVTLLKDAPAEPAVDEHTAVRQSNAPSPAGRGAPSLGLLAIFVAGVTSLAGEVLFTRVLRIMLQGTTVSLSLMLANYLLGIALGSALSERLARRFDPLRLFVYSQIALSLMLAAAVELPAQLLRVLPLLQGEALMEPHNPWHFALLSMPILLPIAVLLGMSVPLGWRILKEVSPQMAGTKAVGRTLGVNTLGGLVGALSTGFILIPAAGVGGGLRTVAAGHLFVAALLTSLLWRKRRPSRASLARGLRHPAAAFAGISLLVVLTWPVDLHLAFLLDARNAVQTAMLKGPSSDLGAKTLFLEEGKNTTVSVTVREGMVRLYNDGRPESGVGGPPPGFGAELAMLGALPTVFAESQDRALVVGLGAGHTTTMLLAGDYDHITVVELEAAVVDGARVLHEDKGLEFPLDDPRTSLVVDDARVALAMAAPESLDAVVSQPSHPWLAGASALYSTEFFALVKRALNEGGVFSLWVNLFRADVEDLRAVTATLMSVFPHVSAYVVEDSSFILAASKSHLRLTPSRRAKLESPELAALLRPLALDYPEAWVASQELDTPGSREFVKGASPLFDDAPRLEFSMAQTPASKEVSLADIDSVLREIPWLNRSTLRAYGEGRRLASALVTRIDEVESRPGALARLEKLASVLRGAEGAYVRGALADAEGRVDEAIAHYEDAHRLPEARESLLSLLKREGRADALLRMPYFDAVDHSTYERRLLAALFASHMAQGRALPKARFAALAHDGATPDDELDAVRFVQAFAPEGVVSPGSCTRARSFLEATPLASLDLGVLRLLARCQSLLDDDAGTTIDAEVAVRRSLAHDATIRARRCEAGGNYARAQTFHRFVLRLLPGNATASLARIEYLHTQGDEDGARALLREALSLNRDIDDARAKLRALGKRLGLIKAREQG